MTDFIGKNRLGITSEFPEVILNRLGQITTIVVIAQTDNSIFAFVRVVVILLFLHGLVLNGIINLGSRVPRHRLPASRCRDAINLWI